MSRLPQGPDPVLVGAAHGTRNPDGAVTTRALLDAVRAARPGLDARECYVDVHGPTPEEVLAGVDGPAVLLPLLLSVGYHVGVDLPRAAGTAAHPVVVGEPLGPDGALVDVLVDRLAEAGISSDRLSEDDEVVLAAAGSSDPASSAAVEEVAAGLSGRLGRHVRPAYSSAVSPRVPCAVARGRIEGQRVVVATYLLAPGLFTRRAEASRADVVAPPLGVHPRLVELVLRRYDEAAARLPLAATGR
ncbi:MAG: sirohydrochlorin chelatase [Motilibacteraceae bacterium]